MTLPNHDRPRAPAAVPGDACAHAPPHTGATSESSAGGSPAAHYAGGALNAPAPSAAAAAAAIYMLSNPSGWASTRVSGDAGSGVYADGMDFGDDGDYAPAWPALGTSPRTAHGGAVYPFGEAKSRPTDTCRGAAAPSVACGGASGRWDGGLACVPAEVPACVPQAHYPMHGQTIGALLACSSMLAIPEGSVDAVDTDASTAGSPPCATLLATLPTRPGPPFSGATTASGAAGPTAHRDLTQGSSPASRAAPALPSAPKTVLALGSERRMTFFRLRDFEIVRALGTGTFGRVYLVRYTGARKYFALKRMRKIDVLRLQQVEHVRSERALLARLAHPFIVRLYAAMQDDASLYMLMEYASGGELFHYLRRAHRFGAAAARFYAAELVLALEYMHAHGVAYRDLKPENLLLDADGHLKLADFGFAKVVTDMTYTLCGTPEYLAPEIIAGHGYNQSGDWWALGVLLFEMLTGSPPFVGPTPTAVYERTLAGRICVEPGTDLDALLEPSARDLIAGLLAPDVSRRLGCTDRGVAAIKESAFFARVDWERVLARGYVPPIVPPAGDDASAAVNFPHDNSASSMDVVFENELDFVRSQGVSFAGFVPDSF